MKAEIIRWLEKKEACGKAVEWAKGKRTPQSAWDSCERGDWMLWLIGRIDGGEPWSEQRKRLVLAACKCARLSLKYVPAGDKQPVEAIELAEKWASGKRVERADLRRAAFMASEISAAYAAYAVARAASATSAAHAAYAAAHAAYTADAAWSAARAASAAYAAASAASTAYEASDAADVSKRCADIVRNHYPKPPEV